jgi:predicted Zn finger-like uncharacterized protein
MLLACPSCETRFQVAAAALGPEGRTVRCAQCRHRWFATAEPVMESVMEAAEATESVYGVPAAPVLFGADVGWAEAEAVEIESPSIAAEQAPEITVEPGGGPAGSEPSPREKPRPVRSRPARRGVPRPALAFFAVVGLFAVILGARATIVSTVPSLAGLYAAIGFPVNLRGLEFRKVTTKREMQDGIPVLVIDGEVVNVARHPVEIPRVRLAVLGAGGQELYSWTTLLQRSILGDHEKVPFRSRLASPPPGGQQVMVRFLTRSDLMGGGS